MSIIIREYTENDIALMIKVWNEIVESGIAFPQIEELTESTARRFFLEQSFTGVAENTDTREILGVYILHPNNVGRCGHIANSSYAVRADARGNKIGERMVKHSLEKANELGFKIIQFNAVVKTNYNAARLYEKLGFVKVGEIPKGFLMKDGCFEDIMIYYREL